MPKACEFLKIADNKIKFDGDLSDWPDANRIPASLFCLKENKAKAVFWAGWSEKGLYLAVEARDSKCIAIDPEWFWDGADCLGFAPTLVFQGKFMSDDISWPIIRKAGPFNTPGKWGEVTLK